MKTKKYDYNNKPELNMGDIVILVDPCDDWEHYLGIILSENTPYTYTVLYYDCSDKLEMKTATIPNSKLIIEYYIDDHVLQYERMKIIEIAIAGDDTDIQKVLDSFNKEE